MPTGGTRSKANAKDTPFAVTAKEQSHTRTGSCFDTTNRNGTGDLKVAGGHDRVNEEAASVAALREGVFSEAKSTERNLPTNFLKKGTGDAGQSGTSRKGQVESQKARSGGNGNHIVLKGRAKLKKSTEARCNNPNTQLRTFYERGDLPIQVDHRGVKNGLLWKVDIDQLDFHHYLPIFFAGLREVEEPYNVLGSKGCEDMLNQGGESKVLPVIPQLIIPIKKALNTRDKTVICKVCKILQLLLTKENGQGEENLIGQAFVPYYRQILPVLNIFINDNRNVGDKIQYDQQNDEVLGDVISKTLEALEMAGGQDAFINVKCKLPFFTLTVFTCSFVLLLLQISYQHTNPFSNFAVVHKEF